MKNLILSTLCTLTILSTTGCIAVADSDRCDHRPPTLGKQLQDLKSARENGAITDGEYQQAKSKFLASQK